MIANGSLPQKGGASRSFREQNPFQVHLGCRVGIWQFAMASLAQWAIHR